MSLLGAMTTATAPECGTFESGSISTVGEVVTHSVQAIQGQRISLKLTSTGGTSGFMASMTTTGPNGESYGNIVEWVAPSTGTYTVQVRGNGSAASPQFGSYDVGLVVLNDLSRCGRPLDCNAADPIEGWIGSRAHRISFNVQAVAGDQLHIQVEPAERLNFRIYSPEGGLANSSVYSGRHFFNLVGSGNYGVIVEPKSTTSTPIHYSIKTDGPGACGPALSCGVAQPGVFESIRDRSVFRVFSRAGERFRFRIAADEPGRVPIFRIYDEAWTQIAAGGSPGLNPLDVTFRDAGSYRVFVIPDVDYMGSFHFSMLGMDGDNSCDLCSGPPGPPVVRGPGARSRPSCPPANPERACIETSDLDGNATQDCLLQREQDDQGNRLELWCTRRPANILDLRDQTEPAPEYSWRFLPQGRPSAEVGHCRYGGGINEQAIWSTGDSNGNGTPDCFVKTRWVNYDDADSDSTDHKWWDYVADLRAWLLVRTGYRSSYLGQGPQQIWHGPDLRPLGGALVGPDLMARSIPSRDGERMSLSTRRMCDVNLDGVCDLADESSASGAIGSCLGQAGFRHGADIDGDRCVDGAEVSSVFDSDADGDGWIDSVDSCPVASTTNQVDSDSDEIGDECDVCPLVMDREQRDSDHDGIGDACDSYADGDSIENQFDNCPFLSNADQRDLRGLGLNSGPDGIGDSCACGDLNLDGGITSLDVAELRRGLARVTGAPLTQQQRDRCDVGGRETGCSVLDAVLIERALAGRDPGLLSTCRAYVGGSQGAI
ncbi:MAG: thrombospondin type 3 repeat-containing protein [Deltaproteobacteria bacterium]|nr:thrombospondin type 3 repeat-containing protein [Deltaproteobacteria bacterium]